MVGSLNTFYATPARRRGRPLSKRSVLDLGTPELRTKRHHHRSTSSTLTSHTTLCSKLHALGMIDTDRVEHLTHIYKLRRRYLNLVSAGSEGKSFFTHILNMPQKNCGTRVQREHRNLEILWRDLCDYLDNHMKIPTNICVWSMLDQLFHTYDYDHIEHAYTRHKHQFSERRMDTLTDITKTLFLVFERDIHALSKKQAA